MNQEDSYQLARALLLIGGILAIAFGAISFGNDLSSYRTLTATFANTGPLLAMVVGVVALVASSRVKDEAIDIILAVLGFLAGGLGGVLVAIGGIWAIISKHTLKGQQ